MRFLPADIGEDSLNPIDLLEEVVVANEWAFDRSSDHELIVETTGRWCDYRMFFIWREDLNALYFTCVFDTRIPEEKRTSVNELVCLVNEKLWLGHFDLTNFLGIPGEFEHPKYLSAIEIIVATARRHGKGLGFMAADEAWAKRYRDLGFNMIAAGLDQTLLQAAIRRTLAPLRGKA